VNEDDTVLYATTLGQIVKANKEKKTAVVFLPQVGSGKKLDFATCLAEERGGETLIGTN
jgi:hypothetical protein